MFKENKYKDFYYQIINGAQSRTSNNGYTEKHHIIPKFLGGDNSKKNLVTLTAREHFLCHWLLTKMVTEGKESYQAWNAFGCMLYLKNDSQQRYKVNSRLFQQLKEKDNIRRKGRKSPTLGMKHSNETKKKMSRYRRGVSKSEEHKRKMSESRRGVPKSEEHKIALKKAWENNKHNRIGENHPLSKQGGHRDDTKEKIRQSILSAPKIICNYCGKENTPGNHKRWHGARCKNK